MFWSVLSPRLWLGWGRGPDSFFCISMFSCPSTICAGSRGTDSFPHLIILAKINWPSTWGFISVYFWTFISIPLISVSGSVPALHGLSCSSFFLFIRMPFIAFSCRISLAGTSSTMLNTGGKSRRHRLVSDLWGKEFSLSALSVVSAVSFSRCPLPGWGRARPSLVIWVLLSRNDVGFCQIFSVSTEMVMSLFFFFCPLLVCGVYDNWCGDGEPSLH